MTEAISATAPGRTSRLRPLTERILAAVPGPRGLWLIVWALVPSLNAGANLLLERGARSAVWDQSGTLIVLNYAAVSAAVVVTLWGTGRIARRLEELRGEAKDLELPTRQPFHDVNRVFVPLVAAGVTAAAFATTTLIEDGWTAAVLRGATWLIVGVPLCTFLWTYASLQLGLHRLGQAHLSTDAIRAGPSLGLRPLGDLAFMGLWMLLAWLIPLVLTGLPEAVGVVIGLFVLAAGLATFFLSMLRLHRQMAEVKGRELATARDLYSQAYEPVRASPTLETLERQAGLLGTAAALEKRASEIHEWPIDEGTWARVITIATSVTAITIARLILDPLGL
jgi:hypothetical protein